MVMIKDLFNLFFPKVCYGCTNYLKDFEKYLCTHCRHELPLTNFHFTNDNTVKKVLYGRVELENATALLRYQKKGIVQELLHNLKYRGYEDISHFLGEWLGEDLKNISDYKTIDCVIPVPLHPKKLRKRGYNQVSKFGKEIAKALEVDYVDSVLKKKTNTSSQVYKNRLTRWFNPEEHFVCTNLEVLKGKHILLVDDIITTGATIEACIEVLNAQENHKISLATMAIA
jgi:ComF family protein